MSSLVKLDSNLVEQLRVVFIEMTSKMGPMGYSLVDQDILPGITVDVQQLPGKKFIYLIDNVPLQLDSFELENPGLANKVISCVLARVVHTRQDIIEDFKDMLAGFSMWTSFSSPLGIEVKYHKDMDGQRLMLTEAGKIAQPIYAFEEAVNMDISVSPECLTPTITLENRIWQLFGDYIMADRVPHLVDLGVLCHAN